MLHKLINGGHRVISRILLAQSSLSLRHQKTTNPSHSKDAPFVRSRLPIVKARRNGPLKIGQSWGECPGCGSAEASSEVRAGKCFLNFFLFVETKARTQGSGNVERLLKLWRFDLGSYSHLLTSTSERITSPRSLDSNSQYSVAPNIPPAPCRAPLSPRVVRLRSPTLARSREGRLLPFHLC